MPERPISIECAVIFILAAMILEIIGISVNAVRLPHTAVILIISHVLMAGTSISTIKYLIDIERGRINSRIGVLVSALSNLIILAFILSAGYANSFLVAAVVFDSIGLAFLVYPRSIWWMRKIQRESNA